MGKWNPLFLKNIENNINKFKRNHFNQIKVIIQNDKMNNKFLNENSITIGKYRNKELKDILKDRKYCAWLLTQDWFKESYEYLFNKIKNYDPTIYFYKEFKNNDEITDFITEFKYFNLVPLDELKIELTSEEQKCYTFYLNVIEDIKIRIKRRIAGSDENVYDITAPSKWLQKFEKETELKREDFKFFINAYDLPNITQIVEEIKTFGGIVYKGCKSFTIAKERSIEQEEFWESILKEKYKDKLGTQFKYDNCIFDFIHISSNTIFECKLGIKDFNEDQYKKYLLTLERFNIIYLIGKDCVINMDLETIYTTNAKDYILYVCNIPLLTNQNKFDEIIFDYDIIQIDDLKDVL